MTDMTKQAEDIERVARTKIAEMQEAIDQVEVEKEEYKETMHRLSRNLADMQATIRLAGDELVRVGEKLKNALEGNPNGNKADKNES